MKRLILTGILSCFYFTLSAQILTVTTSGNATDISGTTYSHEVANPTNLEHIVDFLVNNVSGATQRWVITRRIVSQPPTWNNNFCWGLAGGSGSCYDTTSNIYDHSDMLQMSNGQTGVLSTYVTAQEGGCSLLRYYISEDSVNYIDSVDLEVCFNVGLDDLTQAEFTVGPNPAQSAVLIQSSNVGGGILQVVDATGRLIRAEEVELPYTLDVSNLENGAYFLRISLDQSRSVQQKLIIRH